jgi:hypothetical protein
LVWGWEMVGYAVGGVDGDVDVDVDLCACEVVVGYMSFNRSNDICHV